MSFTPPLTTFVEDALLTVDVDPAAGAVPPSVTMQMLPVQDTDRSDKFTATEAAEVFVLLRDARWDRIENFEDGVDRIDITRFDVTFDSLLIERVGLTHYKVYTRDEGINVFFAPPDPELEVPDDAWLLGEDDFIFRDGLADPPLQVLIEQSSTRREALTGTTLPDRFVFAPDGVGDTINRFEHGKDQIDIAAFNTSFEDLEIVTRFDGRVSVRIETGALYDWIQINDRSGLLTAEDMTADDFIF